ncbi:MAG: hypothetical protein J6N21_18860 [Butyrivibrio sp.]|nr:hypothetical protein [Butyrivibrio sp.]
MKKEDGSFVYMRRHFPKREEARKPNPAFPKHRYKEWWTSEEEFHNSYAKEIFEYKDGIGITAKGNDISQVIDVFKKHHYQWFKDKYDASDFLHQITVSLRDSNYKYILDRSLFEIVEVKDGQIQNVISLVNKQTEKPVVIPPKRNDVDPGTTIKKKKKIIVVSP